MKNIVNLLKHCCRKISRDSNDSMSSTLFVTLFIGEIHKVKNKEYCSLRSIKMCQIFTSRSWIFHTNNSFTLSLAEFSTISEGT